MCLKRIKGLLRGRGQRVAVLKESPPQIPPGGRVVENKPSWEEIRRERRRRSVRALGRFQNMPRFQPCPQCHGSSKRQEKTAGGARYHCRQHNAIFFVRAARAWH